MSGRRRGLGALAALLGLGLAGLAVGAEFSPVELSQRLEGPSAAHWLGTDWLGRDLLLRVLQGTRGFFLPGLLAAALSLLVGGALGALAGYDPPTEGVEPRPRGWRVMMALLRRAVLLCLSLPQAMPQLVTILLCFSVFGFRPALLGLVCGLLYAGELGQALAARVHAEAQLEYVEALRAEGLSAARVLGLHILWRGCRGLVFQKLLHTWAFVMLVETTLSFLPGEFGLQEPTASWGNILQGSQDALLSGAFWAAGVITALITGFVVLSATAGDALSEEEA